MRRGVEHVWDWKKTILAEICADGSIRASQSFKITNSLKVIRSKLDQTIHLLQLHQIWNGATWFELTAYIPAAPTILYTVLPDPLFEGLGVAIDY